MSARVKLICLILIALLAACGGQQPQQTSIPSTATLRGALVPTRVTLTPSNTPTATATSTATSTDTPTPTQTFTPTDTATPTATPTSTATATATNTPTDTSTPTPSFTPTVDAAQVNALIQQGDDASDAENYEDALDAYSQAITLDENASLAYLGRGYIYLQLEEYENAVLDLDRVIELDPENDIAFFNRGTAYSNLDDYEEAAADYSRVLEINPDDIEAYVERANAYIDLEEYDAAFEDYDAALVLDPEYDYAYVSRGIAYYFIDDFPNALADLRRYVELLDAAGDEIPQDILNLIRQIEALVPTATPGGPPVDGTRPQVIMPGQTVQGVIQGQVAGRRYTFMARPGDVIGIRMAVLSGSLDPLLILLDPQGNEIARNDDDPLGTNRDAYLREFAITQPGQYIIVATRFQEGLGSTTGEFSLTLELQPGNRPATPAGGGTPPPPPDGAPPILMGQTVTGRIEANVGSVRFQFQARRGMVIGIRMNALSGNLDPLIILLDGQGNEIARNDDDPRGSSGNSFLRNFTIPADGVYTIVATRFQENLGSTTGEFNLTLEMGQP